MAHIIRLASAQDAASIARVHVTAWQESYSGLLPQAMIAEHDVASRTAMWSSILNSPRVPHVSVALEDDEVRGFVACRAQGDAHLRTMGFEGEISALYLVRRSKGRGIGRALFREACAALKAAGHEGVALWVLEANQPARGFYEAMGGRPVALREEDGLTEVAYGWDA